MPDEADEVVEVVVWRTYLVAAKQVHKRVWFWMGLAIVVLAVLLAFAWHHKDDCRVEYTGGTGLIYTPEHPHHPVTPPPPVVVPPPPAPVLHPVVHRVVHRVVHHHRCCCRCCR